VQSVHAARRISGRTDWHAILDLHDGLLELTHSPVVAVNRVVAVGKTAGPAAGLAALDELARDPRPVAYRPYWAARADLLVRRLSRHGSADAAYASDPDAARRGGALLPGATAVEDSALRRASVSSSSAPIRRE
jgi:predicted RNA polymerase sigma factor